MPTTLSASNYPTNAVASRLQRRLLAAYAVFVVALCGLLAINGPQIRAAVEAKEALMVEEENRAFCSKFGIGPGTSRYAQCAAELTEIRARHLQRNVSIFVF